MTESKQPQNGSKRSAPRVAASQAGTTGDPRPRSGAPPANAAGRVAMSSTKSSIGHLLGAAGAVETIFCLLAIRDQVVPPTINLDNPSVATAIDLVPHRARKRPVNIVLSNSFGFGGTNASLILRGDAR